MKVPTNRITDVVKYYAHVLATHYDEHESRSMINHLVWHFFQIGRIGIAKDPGFRLSESELLKLHFAIKELLADKPLQYIIGETEFMNLKIKVNSNVLIPRPETEELVQLICKSEEINKNNFKILDIGCGSGCIAISLKQNFPEAEVYGLDISEKALELTKENALLNQAPVHCVHEDILNEKNWEILGEFDLVVSNPPYVRELEKAFMKKNVLDFEPGEALFVPDDDPLLFYRAIARFCKGHLQTNGVLYFEINEAFANETRTMLEMLDLKPVEILRDLQGKERFIRVTR